MIYNKQLTLNSLLVKHQNGNRDGGGGEGGGGGSP